MDKKRQVRYNVIRSRNNVENLEWFFLIINQSREIKQIENRIYNLLAMINNESKSVEEIVKRTGLRWKLINFETNKKIEKSEFIKIYKRILKDEKIYRREDINGLENYIIEQLGK